MNTFSTAALARALGGRKVLVRSHVGCQPDAADVAAEITGEAYVVVGIGYLAEIVGEIAGPTVKLNSPDGTTPIPITYPPIPSCWCCRCLSTDGSGNGAGLPGAPSRPLNRTQQAGRPGRSLKVTNEIPTINPTQPMGMTMTKPAPQIVPPPLETPALDPFDPANLRLSQAFTETAGVKKLLTTIPVRKPGAQDFVRVHPSSEYREDFPIIELKDEREQYIVTAGLVPELAGEFVTKKLYTAINRQGVLIFWPIRLPSPEGKDLDWWRTEREAAELAMTHWVRVKANMSLGANEIYKAKGIISEPEWPTLGFWDLIRIAFRDHLIDRIDHPVIKRLRGLA